MAEDSNTVTSALPKPPRYYEEFSLKPNAREPPIPEGTYRVFSQFFSADQPESSGLLEPQQRLVSRPVRDMKKEMKRLLFSIHHNFCDLLDLLVQCPSKQSLKIADLEVLFVNMHEVLNELRSHQARHILLRRLIKQREEEEEAIHILEQQCAWSTSVKTAPC